MTMESARSDGSCTNSDSASASWMKYWDTETNSLSGINLGGGSDLDELMEDKEIASKAVAFVVKSTRKGIVPLCADVANLLRQKRRLEKKIDVLSHENRFLRNTPPHRMSMSTSPRTSHSTSPTPPSPLGSQVRVIRPSSRSSHASSSPAGSPSLNSCRGDGSTLRPKCVGRTVFSSGGVWQTCKGKSSANSEGGKSPASSDSGNSLTTVAIVHHPPGVEGQACRETESESDCSVPELVTYCSTSSLRPSITQNTQQIQCMLLPDENTNCLERKFEEANLHNLHLAQELGAAKKEIEFLTAKLKQYEMRKNNVPCKNNAREDLDTVAVNASSPSIQGDGNCSNSNNHDVDMSERSEREFGCHSNSAVAPFPTIQVVIPSPLTNCKCLSCAKSCKSNRQNHKLLPVAVTTRGWAQIAIGHYVTVKDNLNGYVRYIGHLDGFGPKNTVFVGIELDSAVGDHDGCMNGKQYFQCPKNHGVFMPLNDVTCLPSKSKQSSVNSSKDLTPTSTLQRHYKALKQNLETTL